MSAALGAGIAAIQPLGQHQLEGIAACRKFIRERQGAIMALPMRCGKTAAALTLMREEGLSSGELYLVVVPNRAVGEVWVEQFARWIGPNRGLGPSLAFIPSDVGDFYRKLDRAIVDGVRVVAVTYDAVRLRTCLATHYRWRGVVSDEVHAVGNDNHRGRRLREIPSGWRLGLSGTPYRTRLSQLWRVLDYVQPGYWGNERGFTDAFVTWKLVGSMKRPKRQEIGGKDVDLLNYWLSQSVLFTRPYSECSPLPKNQTIWLEPVEMNAWERKAYAQVKAGALHQLSTEGFVHLQVKNRMLAAFQLLFAPWQVDERFDYPSSKATWIADTLLYGGVGKMLVLTAWAKGIDRLARELEAASGRPCAAMSGDTPQGERRRLVDRFRRPPATTGGNGGKSSPMRSGAGRGQGEGIDCLVMNKVGTEGLDFSAADFVVLDGFFSWSASDLAQAIERGTSMGKTTNTRVAILYAPNSVESWLYQEKLAKAQQLFDRVVSGEMSELSEVLIGGKDEVFRAWG